MDRGRKDRPPAGAARSRLAEYTDLAGPPCTEARDGAATNTSDRTLPDTMLVGDVEPPGDGSVDVAPDATEPGRAVPGDAVLEPAETPQPLSTPVRRAPSMSGVPTFGPAPSMSVADAARLAASRREFAVLLGEFRRTAVLVPLAGGADGDGEQVLTADLNGLRWIFAFSDEAALARFALARGEGGREWPYRRVLGARLLDVAVPLAGVPCGVALDAADGGEGGVLFPPVRGIVPDAVAVDVVGVPGQDVGGVR